MSQQFAKDVVFDGVRGHGENVLLGFIAGLAAAVVGAGIWMGVELATGAQLGLVAIAIGALVGLSVRVAGNGRSSIFGLIGAVLTFASCLAGDILVVAQQSVAPGRDFYAAITSLDLVQTVTSIFTHMTPVSYLILGIGIFEGWKFSMKR